MKILIVEDEAAIVRMLDRNLSAHGYELISASNGEDGIVMAARENVELVLLDISLPGLDGHEILKRLREIDPRLPVLMLTARDDLQNKIKALNAGADDYLTKPFAFEELLARIQALKRRADQSEPVELQAGDLRIDLISRNAWRGDKKIELSAREFALLEYFMRRPGEVLTRQDILSDLWNFNFDPGSNVVDVYVRHLRNKIDLPGESSAISAVRSVGYSFDPPPK